MTNSTNVVRYSFGSFSAVLSRCTAASWVLLHLTSSCACTRACNSGLSVINKIGVPLMLSSPYTKSIALLTTDSCVTFPCLFSWFASFVSPLAPPKRRCTAAYRAEGAPNMLEIWVSAFLSTVGEGLKVPCTRQRRYLTSIFSDSPNRDRVDGVLAPMNKTCGRSAIWLFTGFPLSSLFSSINRNLHSSSGSQQVSTAYTYDIGFL
mmetsp:Transcript_43247/g.85297  ORF Transcript_43247/g.85297 Transcript_43247/m.85297 type:complete len:206 (-) Transcript_43247:746-1363(-)